MSSFLGDWTYERVHNECAVAYGQYRAALDSHYRAYFEAHPEAAGTHPQLAASLEQALPPGMEGLTAQLPAAQRHRHHLSGKSSQTLGLGLLGAAVKTDPHLQWFEGLLAPIPPFSVMKPPATSFERDLDKSLLSEEPRVTAVDFFVETDDVVICTEVKFAEEGLGRCSCGAGAAMVANCKQRVLDRPLYWKTAHEIFFLPDRADGKPCPISAGYQTIRNAAAAIALAGGRRPVFVLIYDDRNPYFRQTNSWAGWPEVLRSTLHMADTNNLLNFRAISWQQLVPAMPLPAPVAQWAAEKHQLP